MNTALRMCAFCPPISLWRNHYDEQKVTQAIPLDMLSKNRKADIFTPKTTWFTAKKKWLVIFHVIQQRTRCSGLSIEHQFKIEQKSENNSFWLLILTSWLNFIALECSSLNRFMSALCASCNLFNSLLCICISSESFLSTTGLESPGGLAIDKIHKKRYFIMRKLIGMYQVIYVCMRSIIWLQN